MSSEKQDFYAKEVTEAIAMACDVLGAAQENLDIEVVETGSNGIFGLIKKKAHIRAAVAGDVDDSQLFSSRDEVEETVAPAIELDDDSAESDLELDVSEEKQEQPEKPQKKKSSQPAKQPEPVSEENAELIRHELNELLSLMGFASEVTAEVDGPTVRCHVSDEHEEALAGQDGKIIDSLQYILRKLAARKVEEKIRLSIDIGEFREKRRAELMERARELAALVKEDGKTQVIPPLNPSERRIVHVALQEDKDIRSRSVGGGLFKKVLIYKPGKGKKAGGNAKRGGRGKGKKAEAKKSQEKPVAEE